MSNVEICNKGNTMTNCSPVAVNVSRITDIWLPVSISILFTYSYKSDIIANITRKSILSHNIEYKTLTFLQHKIIFLIFDPLDLFPSVTFNSKLKVDRYSFIINSSFSSLTSSISMTNYNRQNRYCNTRIEMKKDKWLLLHILSYFRMIVTDRLSLPNCTCVNQTRTEKI